MLDQFIQHIFFSIYICKMAIHSDAYKSIFEELKTHNVALVAVSKTKPIEDINALYLLGQRDFGENYVQELQDKQKELPQDIRWHFIGHLQRNKVKRIASFVHLIHGVDSLRLLIEINKQAESNNRIIQVLLQLHISQEETKFGLDEVEMEELFKQLNENSYKNICIRGLMGMASFTENMEIVRSEFRFLKSIFDKYATIQNTSCNFTFLSMGMSCDYKVAIEEGSNLVRIGSLLFGERISN